MSAEPQPELHLPKLHLVDGTFELFRCFHGAPRAEVDGREVGATRGFLHTIAALLREPDVTHVAVAFDSVTTPAQAKRAGGDPLTSQNALVADATRALGLVIWPMIRRFEADDALASGAAKFRDVVEQVVLCTPDKDLAQCVIGERVVLRDRIRKTTLDEEGVIAKFGVPPRLIPSYLALVGDAADGIPGLPGWGKTSACALLNRYGAIESIPADPAEWNVDVRGKERLAGVLVERRLEALLYRAQIELAEDVPLPHSLADLEWRGAERTSLTDFAATIGAEDALDGVRRWR